MQSSTLLCLLLIAVPMVAGLNRGDIDYLTWARARFRKDLFALVQDAKLEQPLKAIHDDFFACKLNATETIGKVLDTLPTFYPSAAVKYRNLNGLGAMLVGIDLLEIARKCPAKA